tara:strand:- start:34 stop:156 length:123 start_codon:yes stop_codon:yes gene_type:complete
MIKTQSCEAALATQEKATAEKTIRPKKRQQMMDHGASDET